MWNISSHSFDIPKRNLLVIQMMSHFSFAETQQKKKPIEPKIIHAKELWKCGMQQGKHKTVDKLND